MSVPDDPKIYHIVNVDRLQSIIGDGHLWCDAEVIRRQATGTTIGMVSIKSRRLGLALSSHKSLMVGGCVPFYFCPRSIMLYLLHMGNHPELTYKGGQEPIVTLESDLKRTVEWANTNKRRWAFTLSNAGSNYFEDRCNLDHLGEIDWSAIGNKYWSAAGVREGKQAEFLIEHCFPWGLVERIGVYSSGIAQRVANSMGGSTYRPKIEILKSWYY